MKRILLPFFLLISFFCPGQNALDSLLEELKTTKDTHHVSVMIELSKQYSKTDMDLAFKYAQEALTEAQALDFKRGIAKSSHAIGFIYEMQNKPAEAREHFLVSRQMHKDLKDERSEAASILNIGITYAEAGDFDKGRKYMEEALAMDRKIDNKLSIAEVLMNIGGTYEVQKDPAKALQYYIQSLEIRNANGLNATKCLNNIGYAYYAQQDLKNAEKYTLMSIESARKKTDREALSSDYEILAAIYHDDKQFEKAFDYHEKFMRLKDSLMQENNIQQLQELEKKYEAGKKQKEIEELNKEKESRELLSEIIYTSVGVVLLLTTIFVVLLIKRFRVIRAQKLIIEDKNKDITDSITYAKRIQNSLFPTEKYIEKTINRLKKK